MDQSAIKRPGSEIPQEAQQNVKRKFGFLLGHLNKARHILETDSEKIQKQVFIEYTLIARENKGCI